MGVSTIDSEVGDGEYIVTTDEGSAILTDKINKLAARQVSLGATQAILAAVVSTERLNQASLRLALQSAINAYSSVLSGGGAGSEELAAVEEANKSLLNGSIDLREAELHLSRNQAEIISGGSEIAYLSGFDLETTHSIWCADYTLDQTGEIDTIEIPGEPAKIVIAPGARSLNVPPGAVLARPAQDSKQLFYNLALLPGWQKYMPTYRTGAITLIDYDMDTCSLTLDAATSSAQSLDINQASAMVDVPIEYMTCDSNAFEVGDRVIIELQGQNWDDPRVIGFESNPSSCGLGNIRRRTDGTHAYDPAWPAWPTKTRTIGYNSALDQQPLLDILKADTTASSVLVEHRIAGGSWVTLPIAGYNIRSSPYYVFGWFFEITQYFPPHTGGTGGIINDWLMRVRLMDATYDSLDAFYELFSYGDSTTWPLCIDVLWAEFDCPEKGYQILLDDGLVDEIKVSVAGEVYYHATFKVKDGEVYNFNKIDLVTDSEADAVPMARSLAVIKLDPYDFPA